MDDATLVNARVEGFQGLKSIKTLADGSYVVKWSDQSGSGLAFDPGLDHVDLQQQYDASGVKIGAEMPAQDVSGVPDSGFILLPDNGDVEFSRGQADLVAQAHDWHGQPVGSPITIATGADAWSYSARLLSPSGDIALAWQPVVDGVFGEIFTTVLHLQVIHEPGQPLGPDHFFFGTVGDDNYTGTGGSDGFTLGGGTNLADGGAGIDFAYYMFDHTKYSVQREGNVLHVSGIGTDTLVDVERIVFADRAVAFDAHAGITSKIIGAVFGAADVPNIQHQSIGIGLLDAGMSYPDLMQLALNARLGGPASNEAVVDLLYGNVVGHAPDAQALQVFTGWLDSGLMSQAELGIYAAEHPLNALNIDLVGLAATGVTYG
jgi:hypothetical protein